MKRVLASLAAAVLIASGTAALARSGGGAEAELQALARDFTSPPNAYRPIAAYQVSVMSADLKQQLEEAFQERGYGAFLFAPSADPSRRPSTAMGALRRPVGIQLSYPPGSSKWLPKAVPGEQGLGSMARGRRRPGTPVDKSPGYFTDAWFAQAREALDYAKSQRRFATYYDEVGFPSGMADHSAPPKYFRKVLRRHVASRRTAGAFELPALPGTLQAAVAVEAGGRRIDLTRHATAGGLVWQAPPGDWRVEAYVLETAKSSGTGVDYYGAVDYLDPEAVGWFIDRAYQPLADRLKPYLGDPISMTFFDDVGIFPDEKTWGSAMNARFKAITGRDAATYYPALWGDIGPETAAARVGFFKARAQLQGEGFPKLVTAWARRHGLQSSGHAPGQYDPQPTDMTGDPFVFYRHVDVPMVDVIFGQGHGRDGFKLISSSAQVDDKPVVVAENFTAAGDENGYRRTIELFVRGVTRFVTSPYPWFEPIGKPADFSEWVGRSSLMLQGGRNVVDVAVVYPIESLQAFYSFDAPGNPTALPPGTYISDDHDYQAVGAMLLDGLHRNFTFLHPDDLARPKLKVSNRRLVLDNRVNRESYRAVILPGGEVISVRALRKLKAVYDAGGVVIATSRLPSRSAEFRRDPEVRRMVAEMFGPEPGAGVRRSRAGGQSLFLRDPSVSALRQAFDRLQVSADVEIEGHPTPTGGNGVFSYIHKARGGAEVYFFGNSSSEPIRSHVLLRGRFELERWDPHTGTARAPISVEHVTRRGETYTRAPLQVGALSSMILVAVPDGRAP